MRSHRSNTASEHTTLKNDSLDFILMPECSLYQQLLWDPNSACCYFWKNNMYCTYRAAIHLCIGFDTIPCLLSDSQQLNLAFNQNKTLSQTHLRNRKCTQKMLLFPGFLPPNNPISLDLGLFVPHTGSDWLSLPLSPSLHRTLTSWTLRCWQGKWCRSQWKLWLWRPTALSLTWPTIPAAGL